MLKIVRSERNNAKKILIAVNPSLHLNVSNPLPLQHFTIFISALLYTGKQDVFFGESGKKTEREGESGGRKTHYDEILPK